jgi:hypothetical protein
MVNKIQLFLLVLSIIYSVRYLVLFLINLFGPNPEPMILKPINKVFLYLASAYVLTAIITVIT